MRVRLLLSPYDSGHYGERMGAGPLRLIDVGLESRLRKEGHEVETEHLRLDVEFPTEIAAAFALHRAGVRAVEKAIASGAFPLLLSGNCNATIGPLTGTRAGGLIWFDSHGEFNTPETTTSGFLDGMGLAVITGACFRTLAAQTPGFRPLPGRSIVLVGARDFDPGETDDLLSADVTLVSAQEIHNGSAESFAWLDNLRAERVHMHFDLDALDPSVGMANTFHTAPGGLSVEDAARAIMAIRQKKHLVSATFASYEPGLDADGTMSETIIHLIEQTVGG